MTKKEIVEAYYPLVPLVVNKLLQGGYKHLKQHRDDLVSEGVLGLYKAIDRYDPTKGSSAVSFYSQGIRQAVKDYIRGFEGFSTSRYISIDDIQLAAEEVEYVDPDFTLIDKYEPKSEVDQAIYHRIIMGSCTYREIADEFGLTRKSVMNRKQHLVRKLRKQMTNDNVLEEVYED